MGYRTYAALFCAATAIILVSGCARKSIKKEKPVPSESTAEQSLLEQEEKEASVRGKQFSRVSGILTVHFDYDRYVLKEDAGKTLQKNSEWLKRNPEVEMQIEGHCDERGTIEYNLALGQRRATAVRNYYKALGIKTGRMSTISYGEEKPVCHESTEKCWQLNRRAETLILNK